MEKNQSTVKEILEQLPGLNCGSCGFKSCEEFAKVVAVQPEEIKRCINLRGKSIQKPEIIEQINNPCNSCSLESTKEEWRDFLGRDYDFVLQPFPNEPGPRETILPHNPSLTKELEIRKDDIIIGRPMGISCGCPITHCGTVMDVDYKTGVIVWCVTGPLQPRFKEFKDLGYYSAQAYEGLVRENRKELKIGTRYWFLPCHCMLQWRHSGLLNFMTKTKEGVQVRIEGLWIG
jgi:uncharacterized Fe-S cluster-containing protein